MRYAYASSEGEVIWHTQPLTEEGPPTELVVEGKTFKRSYRTERCGVPPTKGWPMVCEASGVHPEDAQRLRDEFVRQGVPTEVTRGGDPIYRNAAHRKRALSARGMYDRRAYY